MLCEVTTPQCKNSGLTSRSPATPWDLATKQAYSAAHVARSKGFMIILFLRFRQIRGTVFERWFGEITRSWGLATERSACGKPTRYIQLSQRRMSDQANRF